MCGGTWGFLTTSCPGAGAGAGAGSLFRPLSTATAAATATAALFELLEHFDKLSCHLILCSHGTIYMLICSGHGASKAAGLPDVPTDEGVRKVITLHLNAQLVRRQQQAEDNKDNDYNAYSPHSPHPTSPCDLLGASSDDRFFT